MFLPNLLSCINLLTNRACQAEAIDSLEPSYSCPRADALFSDSKSSANSTWAAHLDRARELFLTLDSISGIAPDNGEWHSSFDHYFDNLSSRLCHAKPLPCNITNFSKCVTRDLANTVFRLGQFEYSHVYRDSPTSLAASAASQGVWIAELAQHIRDQITDRDGSIIYRHNIAHDGSMSRILSVLQLDVMVWPGMGAEVIFELYRKAGSRNSHSNKEDEYSVRVLFGGQVMQSSSPELGVLDMIPAPRLLAYLDGLVGERARFVRGLCGA